MPNWSYNNIVFKGSKEDILALINEGLKNSGFISNNEFDVEHLDKALETLQKVAKHKISQGDSTKPRKVTLEDGLTLRTFLPMPDTYLIYDTTNYASKFPEAAKEQEEKYGIVGWYSYNLDTLGCKWDSDIESIQLHFLSNGRAAIDIYCETPWSLPEQFINTIAEKFNLSPCYLAEEEGGFYYFYQCENEDGTVFKDVLPEISELSEKVDFSDSDQEQQFWEDRGELSDRIIDEFYDQALK